MCINALLHTYIHVHVCTRTLAMELHVVVAAEQVQSVTHKTLRQFGTLLLLAWHVL